MFEEEAAEAIDAATGSPSTLWGSDKPRSASRADEPQGRATRLFLRFDMVDAVTFRTWRNGCHFLVTIEIRFTHNNALDGPASVQLSTSGVPEWRVFQLSCSGFRTPRRLGGKGPRSVAQARAAVAQLRLGACARMTSRRSIRLLAESARHFSRRRHGAIRIP